MRVLVTDGENRAALAVARSLGRAGHEILVGEKHAPSLAHTSRYCTKRIVYPDPISEPDEFVDYLVSAVRNERIDVVLPIADITTFLTTRHRDRFEGSCALPFAPADVVERAANKVDMVQTALRLGVPVPRSVVVNTVDEVPALSLDFPLVIKPWRSRIRTPAGWLSTAVSYAADRDALMQDLQARPAHQFPVMLQERIDGPGIGVFACYNEGRAVALFSHRRLRERPPWGGVSVLSESVALPALARDYATRLLDEIGWHGVAMVEFKHDVRDDVPKLMEINGRFWGSLQLAIDAGVDFPALLMQTVSSGQFGPQPPYRVGVRSRWLWGDFDSLLLTFRGGPGGTPNGASSHRLPAVLEFAKFWGRDLHYDNPKWHDLRPGLFETYRRFQKALSVARHKPSDGATPASEAVSDRRSEDAATPALKAHSTSSLNGTGLDEQQWNAIAAQNDTNSIFQTHQWMRSWLASFSDRYEPTFVTVEHGSEVVGVAPLILDRFSSRDRVMRFLGDTRADYCDFVVSRDKPRVLQAMFDVLDGDDRWNMMELVNIPAYSRTTALIQRICQRAGYHIIIDDQYACPTLIIEGREHDALEILNKPSMRRKMNYFQRSGELVCRHFRTAAEIEPFLDAFFDQHVARWGQTDSPSLFTDWRNRDFYRQLTRSVTPAGWVLFTVIEFNGRPIAFHYGFDYNQALLWYKPSFDVAQAAHSPGMVLVRHLIEYALANQRRELDFTLGDEAFKKRFTNLERKTVQLQIFRDYGRYMLERSKRGLAATMKKLPV